MDKSKYFYLVEEKIISKDDLDFYSEVQLEKLAKVYERVKRLKKGKTCVWFWRKNFDWWTFYILLREDIFEKLDIENVKRIFELSLRKIRKIEFLNFHDVFTYSLEAPGNEIKELDRFSTLRMEFNNLILLEIEGDPLKISRKIQSIMTKIFSVSEDSKLPSSEAQTSEAKEAESSSSAERQDQEVSLNSSESQIEASEDEKLNPDPTSRQESQSLESTDSDQDQLESCPDPSKTVSFTDSEAGEAEGKLGREDQASPPESSMDSGDLSSSRPEVESQSEASGADEAGRSLASEEDGCSSLSPEKERGIDSLDSLSSGASSGQEESCCIETGQDFSPPPEESGSLWEISFNPEENQHSYGGGGGGRAKALSARDSNTITEKQVALLLQKLFSSIEDIFKKREGRDFWDARKVIYSSTLAPQNLPTSKFSRPSFRKISLWVDVSGSVSHLADFIISTIVAASRDKDVQVVIGSEAHPERILPNNFHKLDKDWWEVDPVWEYDYVREFENQVEIFLRKRKNRLEQGSLIVIWSDYIDIHVEDLSKLARLFKPYKVVWLCSHGQKEDADYTGNESFKLEKFAKKQGHLFLWKIDSPEGIKKAIKTLNIKRRR